MRRVALAVLGVSALFAGPTTPAFAAPSTPPANKQGSAGALVCTIDDDRLLELSGLVTTDSGYLVINDSNDRGAAMRIFYLDKKCNLSKSVGYPGGARDPEDVAVAPDGTVWVADIGDNLNSSTRRATVALWKLAPESSSPVIYRLTYPDGPHDAEALLLDGDGSPIIVTKELTGPGKVYVPTGALQPNTKDGVKLRLAGEVKAERTGTPNKLALIGQNAFTGGAISPDGKKVALRTYADAYEWDVPDGDVVKAITNTKTKPRITPMPEEPQGEAIAFTRDGKSYVTVSDNTSGESQILRYAPKAAAPAATGKPKDLPSGDGRSWYQKLSLEQATGLIAGLGVLGLLLVVAGIFGIRRSRAERRAAAKAARAGAQAARGSAHVSGARPSGEDGGRQPGVYGAPRGAVQRGYDEPEGDSGDYRAAYPPATYGGREQGGFGGYDEPYSTGRRSRGHP